MALVAHYKLDTDSTDNVNGINGSDTAITYGPGQINGAAQFDGSTSLILVNDAVPIQNIWTNGGSFSLWINASSIGEVSGYLFIKTAYTLRLTNDSSGKAKLTFDFKTSGTDGAWTTNNHVITYGTWHQIVILYDHTLNPPSFFLDGQLVTINEDATPTGTPDNDDTNNLYIGNRNGAERTFDGSIDELRIYDTTLTTEEILILFDIVIPTGTRNERAVRTNYPVKIGLVAGVTKQVGRKFLRPLISRVDHRQTVGLDRRG